LILLDEFFVKLVKLEKKPGSQIYGTNWIQGDRRSSSFSLSVANEKIYKLKETSTFSKCDKCERKMSKIEGDILDVSFKCIV